MPITTNLADAPKWGETVPDGQYACTVAHAEETVSANQNDMIKLTLGIVKGEHAGRQLPFDYLVFSDKAISRVAYVLKALGVPIPQGQFALDAASLIGRKALVTVKTKMEPAKDGYDAREQQRIIAYDAAPGSEQDAAVEAALGGGAQPKIQDDSDIPFAYRDDFTVDSI